jgi:hypothetical protein
MEKLNNYEFSLTELGRLTDSERLAEMRREGISLVWTPLPEFETFVLNIFAPTANVFWNFFTYESLVASERKFHTPFLSAEVRGHTHARIARLVRNTGHKKKSDFAHDMLGAWTRSPEFSPDDVPGAIRFLEFRHLSIHMPKKDRDAVQRHFEDQVQIWGRSCLYTYPEQDRIWHFDELDRESAHWKLLNWSILKTTAEDREWLYAEARKYDSDDKLKVLAATLDPRFAIKGIVSLVGVPSKFKPFVDMPRYADVLRLRARLAVMICPMRRIERYPVDLESSVGVFEYPEGVLEEMLQILGGRLAPHRSIVEFVFPSTREF